MCCHQKRHLHSIHSHHSGSVGTANSTLYPYKISNKEVYGRHQKMSILWYFVAIVSIGMHQQCHLRRGTSSFMDIMLIFLRRNMHFLNQISAFSHHHHPSFDIILYPGIHAIIDDRWKTHLLLFNTLFTSCSAGKWVHLQGCKPDLELYAQCGARHNNPSTIKVSLTAKKLFRVCHSYNNNRQRTI